MEGLKVDPNQTNETGGIAIAYRGAAAKGEAESIHAKFQTSGLPVEPLFEIQNGDARLGATEIIITILVSAATKAIIATAWKYLDEYLSQRIGKESNLNIQVVVKEPGSTRAKRFPFSLRQATAEAVRAFSDNLKKALL